MKRFTAVIVLAAVVIAVCTAGILYINREVDNLCKQLQTCMDYADKNDIKSVQQNLEKVEADWQKTRTILMMYIEQDILDDVDNQLQYLEALTKYHKEEFIPTAVLCVAQLREMQQREQITLYSWF